MRTRSTVCGVSSWLPHYHVQSRTQMPNVLQSQNLVIAQVFSDDAPLSQVQGISLRVHVIRLDRMRGSKVKKADESSGSLHLRFSLWPASRLPQWLRTTAGHIPDAQEKRFGRFQPRTTSGRRPEGLGSGLSADGPEDSCTRLQAHRGNVGRSISRWCKSGQDAVTRWAQ